MRTNCILVMVLVTNTALTFSAMHNREHDEDVTLEALAIVGRDHPKTLGVNGKHEERYHHVLLFANTSGSITATDATDSDVASMLRDLEEDHDGRSVAVALSKLRNRGYVLQGTHFHGTKLVFVLEKDFRSVTV